MRPILINGDTGFIGRNFILDWLAQSDVPVVNLDKLTYAGNLKNLASLRGDARYVDGTIHGPKDFIQTNIVGTFVRTWVFIRRWPYLLDHYRDLQRRQLERESQLGDYA